MKVKERTDKINLFASGGKMFTLSANELPSARGFGESVRMMADIGAEEDIVQAFVLDVNAKYLLVSRHGNGFVIPGDACLAQTKNGKQVMNTDAKNVVETARYIAILEYEQKDEPAS